MRWLKAIVAQHKVSTLVQIDNVMSVVNKFDWSVASRVGKVRSRKSEISPSICVQEMKFVAFRFSLIVMMHGDKFIQPGSRSCGFSQYVQYTLLALLERILIYSIAVAVTHAPFVEDRCDNFVHFNLLRQSQIYCAEIFLKLSPNNCIKFGQNWKEVHMINFQKCKLCCKKHSL